VIASLFLLTLAADPAYLYVGAWPKQILVLDESKSDVIDRIELKSDVARMMWLTEDKKRLVVTTLRDSGIDTIDVATRKVIDSFTLGTATRKVRLGGGRLDPTGRYLYLSINVAEKKIDRFEVETPKLAVVDLQEKKIIRSAELPKELNGYARGQMAISPDGKYLWLFRENIFVFDTADFKLVETIELSKPQFPGMEAVNLSPADDPHDSEPGIRTGIFMTTDPVVHKRVWGIAKINLTSRKIDFKPIGPAMQNMAGLQLSPDRKTGYTITVQGEHGDRYCEFLVVDLERSQVVKRAMFPGRTRFSMGLTTDGKQIIIYGAGNTLEFYDSTTLQFVKNLDVAADMTTSLIARLP
jgi:DNA-binding beta-propeller fold protein YncE